MISDISNEPKSHTLKKFLMAQREIQLKRRRHCLLALPAMDRLAAILKYRSGQPYKLRGLLYSLWNGKPASLLELVSLDWQIREDFLQVAAAFGYEDQQHKFFYDHMRDAIERAGQWGWFLEERFNVQELEEYAKSARREIAEREGAT